MTKELLSEVLNIKITIADIREKDYNNHVWYSFED